VGRTKVNNDNSKVCTKSSLKLPYSSSEGVNHRVTKSKEQGEQKRQFKVIDHCSVHLRCLEAIEVDMLIQYLHGPVSRVEPLQPQTPSAVNSNGMVIGNDTAQTQQALNYRDLKK
jgi:hypothetical protein